MKKRLLLMVCIWTLTGCVRSSSIEDIMLVEAVGYDEKGEKTIEATAAATIYGTGEGGTQSETETFTGSSQTTKDIQKVLQSESPKPIRLGKLKVALYHDELAEKGIFPYLDSLGRDARIGRLLFLAIVDGETKKLLEGKYKASSTVSKYLIDLMDQNMRENIPHVNFHDFYYSYHGKGMDPFMPLLKKEGNKVKIQGLALFDGDRYVDSVSFQDCFVFRMLYENFPSGLYQVKIRDDDYLEIDTIASKVRYDIKHGNDHPIVFIDVKLQGLVEETMGMSITGEERIKELEKATEEQLKKRALSMIRDFQQKGIDPLRIGNRAKHQTRGWSEEKWEEAYPDAEVHLDVKVKIIETGIRQ
ncbi:Ger(x)C family spore germination protein [Priestia abyssalis]|uniref:Ger(x)C family spore germination protein n=1 Tax=Priestia abyssalis TaxID=1221450 RepID=UPI0009957CEA|nr:Ger(x)C family spore germination protein [Priestia abyssalis]